MAAPTNPAPTTPALPSAPPPPAGLAQFRAERPKLALALTEPIAKCVARHDTGNPAFHGCIDWHSAVHGTWALTAYTRVTKDKRYLPLLDTILRPELIAKEREHLARDPSFEMPYGRAWFLRLAVDHRRAFDSDLLEGLADDIASSLIAYYTRVPASPMSIAYDSATWALINLYDYGALRHDSRILDFVSRQVKARYLEDGACPAKALEVQTAEFMAICTNWAWLVGKVLPRQEFLPWLARFLPPEPPLTPIEGPDSVHQTALNFSRAWGLWALYSATGDSHYFQSYLSHFNATYAHPDFWKGDYHTVSHWVAQFGMLDLILTYDDWP